jgi:tRNA-dihydrouridine synthase
VALGRIAIARPWTFAEWCNGFRPGSDIFESTAKRLLGLTARHFDEKAAVRRFRKFVFYFAANFRFGHTLFAMVQNSSGLHEIQEALDAFFTTPPELTSAPNMNYFQ